MGKFAFDSVSIHGFRGLKHLKLDELGRINLLVGENNCGKTSVLEAMSVLCDPMNPGQWITMVERRDFGRLDESLTQSLRWSFAQRGQLRDPEVIFEGTTEATCAGVFPLRRFVAKYTDLPGIPNWVENTPEHSVYFQYICENPTTNWNGSRLTNSSQFETGSSSVGSVSPLGEYVSETVEIILWNRLIEGEKLSPNRPRIRSETLTPYSYQSNQMQVQRLSEGFFKSDESNLPLELVQLFDHDIVDIQVLSLLGQRPAIYLKHRQLGPAPLSIFGDALRRAVLIASVLPSLRDGVLFIDEIETGIHVGAMGQVFAWLTSLARQFNVQVFATTHSLEVVDAIMKSVGTQTDDVATYRLKQQCDVTRVQRIAGDVLTRLRHDRGLDVR